MDLRTASQALKLSCLVKSVSQSVSLSASQSQSLYCVLIFETKQFNCACKDRLGINAESNESSLLWKQTNGKGRYSQRDKRKQRKYHIKKATGSEKLHATHDVLSSTQRREVTAPVDLKGAKMQGKASKQCQVQRSSDENETFHLCMLEAKTHFWHFPQVTGDMNECCDLWLIRNKRAKHHSG